MSAVTLTVGGGGDFFSCCALTMKTATVMVVVPRAIVRKRLTFILISSPSSFWLSEFAGLDDDCQSCDCLRHRAIPAVGRVGPERDSPAACPSLLEQLVIHRVAQPFHAIEFPHR